MKLSMGHGLRCGALLVVTACVDTPMLGGEESEIVNGALDSGHNQVVRLLQFDPSYPGGGIIEYCTGTLVTRRAVLTAAHCTFGYNRQPYANVIVEGVRRRYDGHTEQWVWDSFSEPGTVVRHSSYNPATNAGTDLAIVKLAADVTGVPPASLGTSAPVGQAITIVGFGAVNQSLLGYGTEKRWGQNSIDSVDPALLYFSGTTGADAGTCYGDSGGPAFADTRNCIVGVTKGQVGGGVPCVAGPFTDTRVDTNIAWIQANGGGGTCTP